MTRLIVGPFNRVEGDLEVRLEVAEGRVAQAFVTSPLYRGFEQILAGKAPLDALVIAPRICGICSVSQSLAAAAALRDAMGLAPAPNGLLVSNLALAAENAADHLTHFALFFMPDFARAVYAGRPWHDRVTARFQALKGSAAGDAARARARFLHVLGILVGKWPHSLALQPGGVAKSVDSGEKMRLLSVLTDFRRWLEERVYGDALEAVAELPSLAALMAWGQGRAGDFPLFLEVARDLDLGKLGLGPGRYLSHGGFATEAGRLFEPGVWTQEGRRPLDLSGLVEDLSHAWMAGPNVTPAAGITQPDADKPGAYSWCKAPRLDGQSMEVGALARLLLSGHPLAPELVQRGVLGRVAARLVELARLVVWMEDWAKALRPADPFCTHGKLPDEGRGVGLVEAARGGLGHWLTIRQGRIANYQIIAPTTWNFSPRDHTGTPGPLEQALPGAPVLPGEDTPVSVQHVVRSFDPCMVCTVH